MACSYPSDAVASHSPATLSLFCHIIISAWSHHAHALLHITHWHKYTPHKHITEYICIGTHADEVASEQQQGAPSTPQSPTPKSTRLRGRANRPTPLAPSASKAAQHQSPEADNEVRPTIVPFYLHQGVTDSVILWCYLGRRHIA